MASTNKTPVLGLNQYVGTDVQTMEDVNADNAAIDAASANKVNISDIINNLTTNDIAVPLSAAMGKKLNDEKVANGVSGNWTPALRGANTAGNPVYTERGGVYYKIGRIVVISCYLHVSNLGGAVGVLHIDGLPFVATPAFGVSAVIGSPSQINIPANNIIVGKIQSNAIQLNCISNTGNIPVTDTTMSAPYGLYNISATYITTA